MYKRLLHIMFFLFLSFHLIAQTAIDFERLINQEFEEIAKQTKLAIEVINEAKITDAYTDKHNGVSHVYLQQTIDNIPVYNTQLQLHFNKSGKLISSNNQFFKNKYSSNKKANKLSKEAAIISAAKQLELKGLKDFLNSNSLKREKFEKGKDYYSAPDLVNAPIKVNQVYSLTSDGKSLVLAWLMDFDDKYSQDWWEVVVNAENGEIISKENYTFYCAFHGEYETKNTGSKKKHASVKSPNLPLINSESYNVFAHPVESPTHGNQSIVTQPWNDAPNASPLGWHNDDSISYIYLRGNNVFASEDTLNTDTLGFSPSSANLNFDFPYVSNVEPKENLALSITNIFYWSNLMHDVWYQYGFDEESGNFQNSNFGKGGEENDYVQADALDGSGTNNANFSSPPDGEMGRMQMFQWSGGLPEYTEITSPNNLVGTYTNGVATFGGDLPEFPAVLSGNFAIALDSTSIIPSQVCDTIVNPNDINGKIALVDRGDCFFVDKVMYAQQAGAIACVVCNNVEGGAVNMNGTNDSITIPALMLSKEDCDLIKAELSLGNTVSANLSDTGPSVNTDSGLDNGIVCHEYGHGISTRLTGGPSINCLSNAEQMGEGWSDWFGLIMTMKSTDTGPDRRGVGTYVRGEDTNGNGIRLAPYSTDFAVNDYTYENLCEVPRPHGVGFIWGTMLWDLTWAFIDEYGFDPDLYNGTGGNNRAMQLVMDGMKFQPCRPGFVDARDAILLADEVLNNGDNLKMIWEVFAARGLGFSADQVNENDVCDGIAAYDIPLEFQEVFKVFKSVNLNEAQLQDTLTYQIILANDHPQTQTNIIITDTLAAELEFLSVETNHIVNEVNNILTISANDLANGATDTCIFKVKLKDSVTVQFNYFNDAETQNSGLTFPADSLGNAGFVMDTSRFYSAQKAWFAENVDSQSNQIMELPDFNLNENAFLSFWHYYDTEKNWDGGVVEISADNGNTWIDLGENMILNGYNSTIEINQASTISAQKAFSGRSFDFKNTIVDLSDFANSNIKIRFRFSSDAYVGAEGWYIDDIKIYAGAFIENMAYASSNETSTINSDIAFTNIIPYDDGKIRMKFLLEAYVDTSNMLMRSVLWEQNIAPYSQPFNTSPWNYTGSESMTLADKTWLLDVADWVLIQLRSPSNSSFVIETKAALLHENGTLLNTNGTEGISFSSNQNNEGFYVSILHRSHLPIMSNQLIYANGKYDFINDSSLVDTNFIKLLNTGEQALYAGDFEQNGIVNSLDINLWYLSSSLVGGYVPWDADGNGIVNVIDYNWWDKNRSKIGELRF